MARTWRELQPINHSHVTLEGLRFDQASEKNVEATRNLTVVLRVNPEATIEDLANAFGGDIIEMYQESHRDNSSENLLSMDTYLAAFVVFEKGFDFAHLINTIDPELIDENGELTGDIFPSVKADYGDDLHLDEKREYRGEARDYLVASLEHLATSFKLLTFSIVVDAKQPYAQQLAQGLLKLVSKQVIAVVPKSADEILKEMATQKGIEVKINPYKEVAQDGQAKGVFPTLAKAGVAFDEKHRMLKLPPLDIY
jgi:hypothetical protein